MTPKTFFNPKLFLLFLVSLILFFSFLTYWRFSQFKKSLSKVEFPKFEAPKLQTPFSPAKTEEKEFVSPDGKLKIKYGSDWREMGGDGGLLDLNKQQIEGAKILFFAQKISENSIGFLSVQEIEVAPEQKLEEMVAKIKQETATSGTEIINLVLEDRKAIFEIDHKKEGFPGFHSKQKILKEANKAYIISVTSFSQSWSDFEQEASQILNSTQIVE